MGHKVREITLPYNWRPRGYQLDAWRYLENGGRHAELIWHRRSGKDEVALHRTAVAMFERPATYWHMLPLANQARKAIWEAVNPHTGIRRINEVFPRELRLTTREDQMLIKMVNGATWQVVGSDNFDALVGSPPVGIVYSEWALANPSARAYLRPILHENNGWQIFITTPRGNNHAKKTYEAAKKRPGSFAQLLSAVDTGAMNTAQLAAALQEYIDDFGEDAGRSKFEQEYLCSFDAALLGAYYGRELKALAERGGVCAVKHEPSLPVYTAWDLGHSDDTGIWFYQVAGSEIHVLEYYGMSGYGPQHYFEQVMGRKIVNQHWMDDGPIWGDLIKGIEHRDKYRYAMHNMPHDARARTFASNGKSVQEMAWKVLSEKKVSIVPSLSVQDGIQSVRNILPRCYFDAEKCASALDMLKQYQREWDDKAKMFRDSPKHDFTSHCADAFRYLAVAWNKNWSNEQKPSTPRYETERTFNEIMAAHKRRKESD